MAFYIILPLFAGVFNTALITLVLRKKVKSSMHYVFSLFLLTMALWGFTIFGMRASPDLAHALPWERVSFAVFPLSAVFFFHFTLLFGGIRLPRWILPGIYILMGFFITLAATNLVIPSMQLKSYGYAPNLSPIGNIYIVILLFFAVGGVWNTVKTYRASRFIEVKNQAAYFIFGACCFILGGLGDVLPVWGVPIYPTGMFGNIIFCLFTTIAILKYHLLDIDVVIRKGLAYGLISALIFGIYMGIVSIILVTPINQLSPLLSGIIIVVLAIIFHPTLERTQRLVDKWFFRERYDYLKALEQFSQETKDISNLKSLSDSLINLVSNAMGTSKSCLLVPDYEKQLFIPISFQGLDKNLELSTAIDTMLTRWLRQHGEILKLSELDMMPQLRAITIKERAILEQINAELIVSLKTDKGLAAILILGPKKSEEVYSENDLKMLKVVMRQIAISLDNARLYEESQKAYKELEMAQDRLISSERLKALGEMTSGIAHDFNNALTTILGGAQLSLAELDKSKLDKRKVERDLTLVEQAAVDAGQMVRRLQDFARLRADHDLYTIDPNAVIKSAVEMIKPILDEQSQAIEADVEVVTNLGKIGFVEGNESDLRESLVNILINAVQAMPDGGKITIKSEQKNGSAVISIADTGIGMAEEIKNKVFEPFFTTKGHKGLGMGLSVVYGIISRHNGQIAVDSKPEEGTTFRISIPVTEKKREDVVTRPALKSKESADILVIDDDEGPLYVICKILAEAGYKVDTSNSGKDGLSLAQKKDYDLVITDLGMPDISGRHIAAAVKAEKPRTHVILVTGWGVQLDLEELKLYGVDSILTKPFDQKGVLNLVNQMLNCDSYVEIRRQ